MLPPVLPPSVRARGVTAVLGPTNTGKTHLAIERMLGHGAGLIGLPLRLLAREVYNRLVERAGAEHVALVTGEEKIKPGKARYWVATAEAMPRDLDVPFVAIDEIQIAADLERGHVFTDRILNRRGSHETLLLGSATMRPMVEKLIPGATIVSRPRLSNLLFAGEKKLTRLPRRTAIVAFSADEVYAIAELIRRQRGGAAVVLGALSPRTRNSQVAMYQNGDVDYMVATDAVGMGLNLDVDHVAFAGDRKFDGYQFRRLNPAEFAQIAGRAGRHVRDGTFGTTGRCDGFEPELVEAIEAHRFDSVKVLQWRNPTLDFGSIRALQDSLGRAPTEAGLTRAPDADDIRVLGIVARDENVRALAQGSQAVERLWEVSGLPDYRKISPNSHAELVETLYGFLQRGGTVPEDWFARQVALSDRTDGDIDTLSTRIAHIRTWTFAANRPDWLGDPLHWQGVTRVVEDRLSDALHERLAQRFVDRRTSLLMRRLRENQMLETEITRTGDVIVEGQNVGTLHGFQFVPDPSAGQDESGRALRLAASKALAGEIEQRAQRFGQAPDTEFALAVDGTVRWIGEPVAKLVASDKALAPRVRVLADEQLTGATLEAVQTRLDIWIGNHLTRLLGPLLALEKAEDVQGLARGIAFQLVEALGVLDRARVSEDLKALDQEQRASLRKHGVRFGAYHVYMPALMKPAPRTLAAQLWALGHGGADQKGLDEIPHLAASGRTSIKADPAVDRGLYRLVGYRVCGERAVRVDILERLADLIRPAIAYRPGTTVGVPPTGAADGDGFVVTVQMTSLVGCSGEDFSSILKGLGYRLQARKGPAITQAIRMPAPMQPSVAGLQDLGGASAEARTNPAPAGEAGQAGADRVGADEAGAEQAESVPGKEAQAEAHPAEDTRGADEPASGSAEAAGQTETQAEPGEPVLVEAPTREDGGDPALAEGAFDASLVSAPEPTALDAAPVITGEALDAGSPSPPGQGDSQAAGEAASEAAIQPEAGAAEPTEDSAAPAEILATSAGEAAAQTSAEPGPAEILEASAGEAAAQASAEPGPAEVVEPEIQVWHPARFDRQPRPAQRREARRPPGRPDARTAGHPAGEGGAPANGGDAERPRRFERGGRPEAGQRRGLGSGAPDGVRTPRIDPRAEAGPRHGNGPRGNPPPAARDAQGDPGQGNSAQINPAQVDPARGGRPARSRDERAGREDRGNRRPFEGRPERGERGADRAGAGGRSWSSEEPRRDRAPDPNSPFAKLLALKEQMQTAKGPGGPGKPEAGR